MPIQNSDQNHHNRRNRSNRQRQAANQFHHDYGPEPYVVNIDRAAAQNANYRSSLWTGKHLQLTLMHIRDEVGLEVHPDHDQFLRIEEGEGLVMMGKTKNRLNFQIHVNRHSAIFVPAGTWHNLVNTGNRPLKLYSLYGPPNHAHGTIHPTRQDAEQEEG